MKYSTTVSQPTNPTSCRSPDWASFPGLFSKNITDIRLDGCSLVSADGPHRLYFLPQFTKQGARSLAMKSEELTIVDHGSYLYARIKAEKHTPDVCLAQLEEVRR